MSCTGRSQRLGQLTVGRVGAIGVWYAWDVQRPAQSVILLRCLSLGRLPAAVLRSSLVQREALHEDQDSAT
jgi:hypothetical protein